MDTGLRNYILNSFNELILRPDAGRIVENAAFVQLKINEQNPLKYWRTLAKAEVDFIIEEGREFIPIEIKYSPFKEPKISRGFRNFLSVYQPRRALVLTQGFWGELKVGPSVIKFAPVWYL